MSHAVSDRFWAKVDKGGECWLWLGANNGCGYGRFSIDGRLVYAHRWAYESRHGPLATHEVIDHICRVKSCVNPDHLEAVTSGENTSRGPLGFKFDGTCRSGRHDVTDPAAIYVQPNGRRRCRACHYEKNKRYAA